MATIKCIYERPTCRNPFRDCKICDFYSYEFYEAHPDCELCGNTSSETRYTDDDGVLHIEICDCSFLHLETIRFEKEIKNYELSEEVLKIGKQIIFLNHISRLEIDGELIVYTETEN